VPYTIEWTPPAIPGSISIELWDADTWSWASTFDTGSRVYNYTSMNHTDLAGCDGWLVNSQCGKIARNVTNSGSYGSLNLAPQLHFLSHLYIFLCICTMWLLWCFHKLA
jgi:hypothetical protein